MSHEWTSWRQFGLLCPTGQFNRLLILLCYTKNIFQIPRFDPERPQPSNFVLLFLKTKLCRAYNIRKWELPDKNGQSKDKMQ
jgi:hypothetical protein